MSPFPRALGTVFPTEKTIEIYAGLYAELRKARQDPPFNDLLIAASAIERDLPLLTRIPSDFDRVNLAKANRVSGSRALH